MHKAAIALLLGALGGNHSNPANHPNHVIKPHAATSASKVVIAAGNSSVIKVKG